MIKFDEQKQIDSVNGALALRPQIEELIDRLLAEGVKNLLLAGHRRHMGQLYAGGMLSQGAHRHGYLRHQRRRVLHHRR